MTLVASVRDIPMTSGATWYQPLVHDPDGPIVWEGRIYRCRGHAANAARKVLLDRESPGLRFVAKRRGRKSGSFVSQNYSREYRIWRNMWSRCYNPLCPSYRFYGAKGVRVCDAWLDFKVFYQDIGPIPLGYSIDRINPEGNYEPLNVRLADAKTQANNKRKTTKAIS
jgi:hypothetical protein